MFFYIILAKIFRHYLLSHSAKVFNLSLSRSMKDKLVGVNLAPSRSAKENSSTRRASAAGLYGREVLDFYLFYTMKYVVTSSPLLNH